MTKRYVLILLAVFGLFAAACGDGDDGGSLSGAAVGQTSNCQPGDKKCEAAAKTTTTTKCAGEKKCIEQAAKTTTTTKCAGDKKCVEQAAKTTTTIPKKCDPKVDKSCAGPTTTTTSPKMQSAADQKYQDCLKKFGITTTTLNPKQPKTTTTLNPKQPKTTPTTTPCDQYKGLK